MPYFTSLHYTILDDSEPQVFNVTEVWSLGKLSA